LGCLGPVLVVHVQAWPPLSAFYEFLLTALAVAATPSMRRDTARTYGQRGPSHLDAWPRRRVGVRAPPASSESSPPPARRAVTQRRPRLSARGRVHAPARPGRHTPRAPHHTGHWSPAAAGKRPWQISARRGFSLSLPVRSLFPRFTSPHLRGLSPTWPRQRPTTAPPAPAFPPRKPSTRVHPCRDRPPSHRLRPPQTTCPFSLTAPYPPAPDLTLPPWLVGYVSRYPTCQWKIIPWAPPKSGRADIFVRGPRDRAHVVGTAPGINKLAAEPDCPTGERHVCAARGLGDNTGVVVAVKKTDRNRSENRGYRLNRSRPFRFEWFQTGTNLKFKF